MNSKLYVGNLSYGVVNADLETLFSESGTVVTVNVIKDRDTGRGKGFGFVEMKNDTEANSAIQTLNETEFMGRNLRVNIAQGNKNSGSHQRRY